MTSTSGEHDHDRDRDVAGADGRAQSELGAPARREVGGRNLPVAIVSGLVLGGLFIGTVFWHPAAFSAVIGLLVAIALVESGRILAAYGWPTSVPVLLAAAAILLVGTYHAGTAGQTGGLAALFVGTLLWQLVDPRRTGVLRAVAATTLLGVWVPFLASYGVLLVTRPVDAEAATLGTIGAAVFTDIGGFAFGVKLGRHKIAPAISPSKSWEGLVGGLAVTAGVAVLVLPRVGDLFDVPTALVLAVAVGLAGFVGDLAESMLKRDVGTKDLGMLVPGHGGVLDRVDGILLAMPVGYYVLELLGR